MLLVVCALAMKGPERYVAPDRSFSCARPGRPELRRESRWGKSVHFFIESDEPRFQDSGDLRFTVQWGQSDPETERLYLDSIPRERWRRVDRPGFRGFEHSSFPDADKNGHSIAPVHERVYLGKRIFYRLAASEPAREAQAFFDSFEIHPAGR